jgi:predicted ArsR family transcriptional regulator
VSEHFTADVASVAALNEPVRRDLYRYVVAQDRPVSREQAAAGVGVAHHVAKFNLDRLVSDGLLDVEYGRPPGRGGPGAGRPAKLYRRAARHIAVSLPERRYDLVGHVLAEAVTIAGRDGSPIHDAVRVAARATGERLAEAGGGASATGAVCEVLARTGYEPRVTAAGVVLANCPFHGLAARYTELVCGMNLDLIDGLIQRLGGGGLRARLDPGPNRCCVTIAPPRDAAPGEEAGSSPPVRRAEGTPRSRHHRPERDGQDPPSPSSPPGGR